MSTSMHPSMAIMRMLSHSDEPTKLIAEVGIPNGDVNLAPAPGHAALDQQP